MKELMGKIMALGTAKLVCIAVVLVAGYAVFADSGPSAQTAANPLTAASAQTAEDAIAQYEMVKRTGDQAQSLAMASWVSQIYLMNKNESEYVRWKAVAEGHRTALYNAMAGAQAGGN